MRVRLFVPFRVTLAGTLATLMFSGCQKALTPIAENAARNEASAVTIVVGKTPSDDQRQAMLAAKDALFQTLSGRLMETMNSPGPAAAIAVCQKEAPQIATDISESHGLKIGRTGVRLRNSNNQPPSWAKAMTDAKVDTPQFVTLTNGDAAALLPIKLQAQCLMCHGPKEQIAPVIQDQLVKLYPNDEAIGFKEGELRGWFWIEKSF